MRILVLSFYFTPDLSACSFRTAALIKELKKIIKPEDKIEIITTLPNRYKSFNEDAKQHEKISENIEVTRIKVGTHKGGFVEQSKLFFKYAWGVINLIKKREKYDIVYATSSKLMTAYLGSVIAKKQKAKLYLDIRDIFIDTLESVFAKSKLKYFIPFFKMIENYTVNSANRINLVSKGFESYFMNINNKIQYSFYTNGIDDIFLNYDFNKNKETKKIIITYAGNIGEGQGLEKIVPGMAKKLGYEYEIHIFGDGSRKKILIDRLTGVNNVKVFDPVNRTTLLEVYKNTDILFLHLNNYEAFKRVLPSKLFEYAATNKFIIAGVSGYAKEFIEENITGAIVFEPCNVDDFYEKFCKVKKFDEINRQSFIEKYKRENIMKLMAEDIYNLKTLK